MVNENGAQAKQAAHTSAFPSRLSESILSSVEEMFDGMQNSESPGGRCVRSSVNIPKDMKGMEESMQQLLSMAAKLDRKSKATKSPPRQKRALAMRKAKSSRDLEVKSRGVKKKRSGNNSAPRGVQRAENQASNRYGCCLRPTEKF